MTKSLEPIQGIGGADRTKCYDNTRISAYKTCPRSYFIRHVLGWTGIGTGLALVFGSAWHNAQDVIWEYGKKIDHRDLGELAAQAFNKTWTAEGLPVDIPLESEGYYAPRTPLIAREMLEGYIESRGKMIMNSEVVAIEQPFAVPIPGMPGHWYIGRLDKVVDFNSQRLVLEHKSTTAYATQGNFRTDYVDSWFMSAQVKGYQFGAGLYYGNVNAVWVDAALVHKKVHNAFKFIPIAHNYTLLSEWLEGTKQWVREISQEEEDYRGVGELTPGMFKKNEESCFGKYGACPYIDICRSVADPSKLTEVPGGFVKSYWEPFSILGLEKLLENENG
jgi:PD-(D/E)XK nuclease superfamily